MKMKTDEELGHDRGLEFETDDEENEAETVADSDEEEEDDDDSDCSKTSSPNCSDDRLSNYSSSWPQSYRLVALSCLFSLFCFVKGSGYLTASRENEKKKNKTFLFFFRFYLSFGVSTFTQACNISGRGTGASNQATHLMLNFLYLKFPCMSYLGLYEMN